MINRTITILLASAAIFGTSMAGCSGSALDQRPLSIAEQSDQAAAQVEKKLERKDYARALLLAEALVAQQPNSGDARALLGRSYLANGRYVSARTAFTDAMTLGNRDSRTIVSLSMAQAGLGNAQAARELLSRHISGLPAGDYGLAMAMAGDAREAVRALVQAAGQPDATARTRQNLAYALAMGGAWAQARLIAGQDLSAKDAEKRMGDWSNNFIAGRETDRVVAMIGIAPRADDDGLPTALALNEPAMDTAEPTWLANASDIISDARTKLAVAEAPAEADGATLANIVAPAKAAAPAKAVLSTSGASDWVTLAAAFEQTVEPHEPVMPAAPAAASKADPLRTAMTAAFSRRAKNQASPAKAGTNWAAGITAPVSDASASDWVVQLGAYDSDAVARDKWQRIAAKSAALAAFNPVNSVFELDGRTFHRVAIRGFGDRATALGTCSTLKGLGQDCFVRMDDTEATRSARAEAQTSSSQQLAAR